MQFPTSFAFTRITHRSSHTITFVRSVSFFLLLRSSSLLFGRHGVVTVIVWCAVCPQKRDHIQTRHTTHNYTCNINVDNHFVTQHLDTSNENREHRRCLRRRRRLRVIVIIDESMAGVYNMMSSSNNNPFLLFISTHE